MTAAASFPGAESWAVFVAGCEVEPVGLCLTWHCWDPATGRDGYCDGHRHRGGHLPDGDPFTVTAGGRKIPAFLPAWVPAGHTLSLGYSDPDDCVTLMGGPFTDLAVGRDRIQAWAVHHLPDDAESIAAYGRVTDLAAATAPLPGIELPGRVSRILLGSVTLERHRADGSSWAVTHRRSDESARLALTRAGGWEPLRQGRCRDHADAGLPVDTAIQGAWLVLAAERRACRDRGGDAA